MLSKKINSFSVLLLLLLSFFPIPSFAEEIQQTADAVIISNGKNHVEYTVIKSIRHSFRVFGINMQHDRGPLNHIDAIVPMLSLVRVREIYNAGGQNAARCEYQATQEMKIMSVIVPDKKVKKQLAEYEKKTKEGQFALRITGKYLRLKKHLFGGQKFTITNSGPMNFDNCLLIESIEIVPF